MLVIEVGFVSVNSLDFKELFTCSSSFLDGVTLYELIFINTRVSFPIILPFDPPSSGNTKLFVSPLIYHAISCHYTLLILF